LYSSFFTYFTNSDFFLKNKIKLQGSYWEDNQSRVLL
jgi:hypothetical protein